MLKLPNSTKTAQRAKLVKTENHKILTDKSTNKLLIWTFQTSFTKFKSF